MYCTNDASTAQALTNSLHLAQILEKELVPACLKLYFSHDDFGAKIQLRNLRSLWRTEVESIEANILDIVDPTAFCVIVEAEARRVASAVKKDQYSQDRDWLRQGLLYRWTEHFADFLFFKFQLGGGKKASQITLPECIFWIMIFYNLKKLRSRSI